MTTTINYFGRMLCALLLCAGVVLTSCEENNPIDDGNNTEQGGNENNGNENGGGQETPEPEEPVTLNLGEVTYYSATFTGHLNVTASDIPFTQVTLFYSDAETFNIVTAKSESITSFDAGQNFTITLTGLECFTKYNYSLYVKVRSSEETYSEILSFTTLQHPYLTEDDLDVSAATDLSSTESANCYIVSEAGLYKFKTVKGNSSESVGNAASADILWETFGTDATPMPCDLISGVCHSDNYIVFEVNETFREGNAVLHAKDSDGNIIWSWHIWLTDQPQEQVYYNDAGTMMDRNLGATSATPGDVGALGLLYQWGRKDPFLSSSSIFDNVVAKSTISWPSAVMSDLSNGTMAYTIANPTTIIRTHNDDYNDWHYSDTETKEIDKAFWTTSESSKSIYDPCPVGWRVPDYQVWANWYGPIDNAPSYDEVNRGRNFSNIFGDASIIWYPASGSILNGHLGGVDNIVSYCWSASIGNDESYAFAMGQGNAGAGIYTGGKALGRSVRCIKE